MEPFYKPKYRADRGEKRFPFHIRLTEKERSSLAKLSKKMKLTAAGVVRKLLELAS
jgi:hypothetical protein